jgi:hypothetical protein
VLLASLHISAAVSTAPWIAHPDGPPAWTPERRAAMVMLSDALALRIVVDWDAIAPLPIQEGTMA